MIRKLIVVHHRMRFQTLKILYFENQGTQERNGEISFICCDLKFYYKRETKNIDWSRSVQFDGDDLLSFI